MINTLIEKGHAYEKNGTVYFKTRSFKEYGKLSKKNIDDLEAGHREIKVAGEEDKEDPLDFVLWKPKKEGEPAWKSPWGEGRPGWHIECSVMSKKYLGDEIDIHAGGEDLIFPHHENEIAQSEAANGKTFSRYWMHNGFLNINNEKMSKSKGNFFTVRDIGAKYPYEVLRFFMLSGAHYRMPLNFSEDLMEAAKNSLERIKVAVERLDDIVKKGNKTAVSEDEQKVLDELSKLNEKFDAAMEDDFNTADAISAIFEMVKAVNVGISEQASEESAKKAMERIVTLMDIIGVSVVPKTEILAEEIEALIEERQAARKEKNFQRADEIRDILLEKGIVLKDTREGVKWTKA